MLSSSFRQQGAVRAAQHGGGQGEGPLQWIGGSGSSVRQTASGEHYLGEWVGQGVSRKNLGSPGRQIREPCWELMNLIVGKGKR